MYLSGFSLRHPGDYSSWIKEIIRDTHVIKKKYLFSPPIITSLTFTPSERDVCTTACPVLLEFPPPSLSTQMLARSNPNLLGPTGYLDIFIIKVI